MALESPRKCWSFSGGHWRKSCLLFAMVIVVIQFCVIGVKDPLLIHKTFQTLTNMRHRKNETLGPLHVLLVSYARTGSSFVGDLLQSLPDTFYYFEPLHFLSYSVLNDSFQEARSLLNKVFNCNVTKIDGFLQWQKSHAQFMKLKRSIKYWRECSKKQTCFSGSYLDATCRKHRTVGAKTIRLKLREAVEMFTSHPSLNLKIIYLMRDPRGSINSRWKYPVAQWCKQDPMCASSKHYCSALAEDLAVVCSTLKDRPEDLHIVRYEDLALDPFGATNRLVRFLGLSSIPDDTSMFLKTHTFVSGDVKEQARKHGIDYPYSTFRNSSITAMSWRHQMALKRVSELQEDCREVLKGMGYYSYTTMGTLRSNINLDENLHVALNSYCSVK